MKIQYIRFGKIPIDGKSKNNLTGKDEKGVSVYEGFIEKGKLRIIIPSLTYSSCVGLSGCLNREVFIVEGKKVGIGSDGEPLLKVNKVSLLNSRKYNQLNN